MNSEELDLEPGFCLFGRKQFLGRNFQRPREFLLGELHRLRKIVLDERDCHLAHAAGFRQFFLSHEPFHSVISQVVQGAPPLTALYRWRAAQVYYTEKSALRQVFWYNKLWI